MILPAVRHNLGIGFIPAEFATEDLRQGTVFEIAVEEKLPQRSIQLVYDTEYPQSVASKTFRVPFPVTISKKYGSNAGFVFYRRILSWYNTHG